MRSSLRQLISYRVIALAAVLAAAMIFVPRFASPLNLMNVGRNTFLLVILGSSMALSMLAGGIDLSIGSVAALATVLGAPLISNGHPLLGVLVTLAIGVGVGALNGFFIGRVKLPDFIMTFSMMYIARGLALTYTQGRSFYNFPQIFKWIGKGDIAGVPFPIIFSAALLLGLFLILNRTIFGREIYAVGVSKQAARYTGLNVSRTVIKVYTLAGLLAAVTGLVFISRLNSADAELGTSWPLQAIAVCVVGGITFEGGQGRITGLLIGGIVMAVISNCINLIGIPSRFQDFFVGFVIILIVAIDNLSGRRRTPAKIAEREKVAA